MTEPFQPVVTEPRVLQRLLKRFLKLNEGSHVAARVGVGRLGFDEVRLPHIGLGNRRHQPERYQKSRASIDW